jgi:hypothetical protein
MLLILKENVLKNLIIVILVIGSAMIMFGCQEDGVLAPVASQNDQGPNYLAKKPAPNLTGSMALTFNFVNPVWIGTITFENHGTYGMRFFSLNPLKGYSQASPFEEIFEIYDLNDPTIVCLRGHDSGVTTLANKPPDPCKYRMNGEVDLADAPFEEWLGRNVHMSGTIYWQFVTLPDETVILVPKTAPGIFRIN